MSNETIKLFKQFEVFMNKNKSLHRVFTSSDNCIEFKSLNNAMNAYGQKNNRVLVEDLGQGQYMVFSRLLTNPVKTSNLDETFKLVGSLI